ncbi:MAG: TetR family transcriptional regulator [Acidimicrobiales bacterium]
MVTTATTGLRERKKEKTRTQLMSIALELFDERGFDEVTVDDIVSAAEVSHRTFYRYFPSKEDVLLGLDQERIDHFADVLRSRPTDEPILASIRQSMIEASEALHQSPEMKHRRTRIIRSSPSLRLRAIERHAAWEAAAVPIIAERMEVDADSDLRPRLTAACAIAAVRVATDVWVAGGGRGDVAAVIDDALELLVDGLHDA